MSAPCPTCKSSLGDCSPDNGDYACRVQNQCLDCINWRGTNAFGPGPYCKKMRDEPKDECVWHIEAPEPPSPRDGHLSAIQARVWAWCSTVFADRPGWDDKRERVHRFIEEAVELAQACEVPQHEVERLVGYVYGRPVGEPSQELGGTVITLAALAEALGLSAEDAALTEVERVERPEVMEKVRAKQVGKDALFAERPPSPSDQRPKLDEWKLAADTSRFGYLLMRNGWTGYELDDGAPGLFSHCWTPKQLAVQIRQDRRATITFGGKVHKVSTPLELRETLDRIAEETSNV